MRSQGLATTDVLLSGQAGVQLFQQRSRRHRQQAPNATTSRSESRSLHMRQHQSLRDLTAPEQKLLWHLKFDTGFSIQQLQSSIAIYHTSQQSFLVEITIIYNIYNIYLYITYIIYDIYIMLYLNYSRNGFGDLGGWVGLGRSIKFLCIQFVCLIFTRYVPKTHATGKRTFDKPRLYLSATPAVLKTMVPRPLMVGKAVEWWPPISLSNQKLKS